MQELLVCRRYAVECRSSAGGCGVRDALLSVYFCHIFCMYVNPSSFCDAMETPPACCKRNPPTCTRKDCCDAAQAAGQCAACCNTACVLSSSRAAARPSANNLADFSSRGPTFDSRFKPDIVAPGEYITSACAGVSAATTTQAAQAVGAANHCNASWASTSDCAVDLMSGTSMATPLVAGALE